MRVIAGAFGGRTLVAPRGREVRPTSDRVREALFSILGETVVDARVLDLFAGSGALGIEALSRGASSAVFVDSSAASITAVRRNLAALSLEAEVRGEPVAAYLQRARRARRQYDLVLVDPPYRQASALGPELSAELASVLAPSGRVVAESDRRRPLELDIPLLTERRYGDTLIRIHGS